MGLVDAVVSGLLSLLDAHQSRRRRGDPVLSTLVGRFDATRALWGSWCSRCNRRIAIPSRPTAEAADQMLAFAQQRTVRPPRLGVLFLGEESCFEESAASAFAWTEAQPRQPVALALTRAQFSAALSGDNFTDVVRDALTCGLVSLVEDTGARSSVGGRYRSVFEEMLHRLLVANPDIGCEFEVNVRVRGASQHPYEVDLFCREEQLAVEVDGRQHMLNSKQKERDEERDRDLGEAGIVTTRIVAEQTLTDPTQCMRAIQQALRQRRKDLES